MTNPADAEDVTQATFLNAFRAFQRGDRPELPRNWLLKIAHNECRQRFRMLSRRPKEVVWDERAAAPPIDESVPTADEIRQALRTVMERMKILVEPSAVVPLAVLLNRPQGLAGKRVDGKALSELVKSKLG